MAHYHWSELFPPHIWQRGQNYYRNGNILDIRYHGNCVTAKIEGTEIYHVSGSPIIRDGERCERRRWRMKGAARVEAVGVQRRRAFAKAHTGHRDRKNW